MVTLTPISESKESRKLIARIPRELCKLRNAKKPWTSYLAYSANGTAVGACAFKSPPNKENQVEIAYHTFPRHEGRGFGSAMARSLIDIAAESAETKWVVAHTLREKNASVRICRRLNFAFEGEVVDPEDGPVWRWEKPINH
jgi:ribosomal-protein-alanine N-acetyltransferase